MSYRKVMGNLCKLERYFTTRNSELLDTFPDGVAYKVFDVITRNNQEAAASKARSTCAFF